MEMFINDGSIGLLLVRWIHLLAGVTWIGLLYYFNFVQGAFFAETDGNTKSAAIQKLVPRALWWFRWSAMLTFLAGAYILLAKGQSAGMAVYATSWGINISVGALLGTIMFLNVWLVIWPNQKIVIASAAQAAGGGQALPNAASAGAKSGLASRTNTLFSVPMLLFMGSASHYNYAVKSDSHMVLWLVVLVIIGALEFNALKGKLGPLTTIKGVIHSGFVLALILFAAVAFLA